MPRPNIPGLASRGMRAEPEELVKAVKAALLAREVKGQNALADKFGRVYTPLTTSLCPDPQTALAAYADALYTHLGGKDVAVWRTEPTVKFDHETGNCCVWSRLTTYTQAEYTALEQANG